MRFSAVVILSTLSFLASSVDARPRRATLQRAVDAQDLVQRQATTFDCFPSKAYTACIMGAKRAYQCCSGTTAACKAQKEINKNYCKSTAAGAACPQRGDAKQTCCTAAFFSTNSGVEVCPNPRSRAVTNADFDEGATYPSPNP